jgi:hypothetical protein
MFRTLFISLLLASVSFAQTEANHVFVTGGAIGAGRLMSATAVQGAPYTATVTNESVQTLADGNRIVQTSTGTTARDSQGRTRHDTPLPAIGNMAPAHAPHLVVIQDPVAQVSYTLDLTDKTAVKNPTPGIGLPMQLSASAAVADAGPAISIRSFAGPVSAEPGPQPAIAIRRGVFEEEGKAQTEDLGSKIMEGVNVNGVRTTRIIAAGQIGNDRPISIVTEVWTSPELKTIVYSKRSDPRMGDQTFALTNIMRAEPDPALFTVPGDFKILETPGPVVYQKSDVVEGN